MATGQVSEWDVPEGSLFVLGDHRGGSTDSRRASVGFVGVDDVVGRAWLSFFPLDTLGILQTPPTRSWRRPAARRVIPRPATGRPRPQ